MMRPLFGGALALIWSTPLLLAACSSSSIGGTCSGNGDCANGLTCNTTLPGGYCTKSCTMVATTSECGSGAICDSLPGGGLGCEQVCTKQSDCRSGFECDGVSGSNVKACKVKTQADGGVPDA